MSPKVVILPTVPGSEAKVKYYMGIIVAGAENGRLAAAPAA